MAFPPPNYGRAPLAYGPGPYPPYEAAGMYQYYPAPMYPAPMRFAPPPTPRHFSIDVECVAIGPGHNDREVAQIALVDEFERVLMSVFVRPKRPVVSFLTPLTGLVPEQLEAGMSLEEALASLRQRLPTYAVLVGQNIAADIRWLGLREGVDFESLIDLSGAFRAFNPTYKNYSYFSLQHEARVLLGVSMEGPHNAITDALISIRLYNKFAQIRNNPAEMEAAQKALLASPLEASFAKKNPSFEGVCMGNKKTCTCGQPMYY